MELEQQSYIDPSHSACVLQKLRDLWNSKYLCDATIEAGPVKIYVHRLVLLTVMEELSDPRLQSFSRHMEIILPSKTDTDAINLVIHYMYTGNIKLNPQTAPHVNKLAKLLKIRKLSNICDQFRSYLRKRRKICIGYSEGVLESVIMYRNLEYSTKILYLESLWESSKFSDCYEILGRSTPNNSPCSVKTNIDLQDLSKPVLPSIMHDSFRDKESNVMSTSTNLKCFLKDLGRKGNNFNGERKTSAFMKSEEKLELPKLQSVNLFEQFSEIFDKYMDQEEDTNFCAERNQDGHIDQNDKGSQKSAKDKNKDFSIQAVIVDKANQKSPLIHDYKEKKDHTESVAKPKLSKPGATDPNMTCPYCWKNFSKANQLARHKSAHLTTASKTCIICPRCYKKFWNISNFNKHIDKHFFIDTTSLYSRNQVTKSEDETTDLVSKTVGSNDSEERVKSELTDIVAGDEQSLTCSEFRTDGSESKFSLNQEKEPDKENETQNEHCQQKEDLSEDSFKTCTKDSTIVPETSEEINIKIIDVTSLIDNKDLAATFAWESSLSKQADVPEKDDEVASPQKSATYSEKSSKENFEMITPPLLSPEENPEFVKCSVRVFKENSSRGRGSGRGRAGAGQGQEDYFRDNRNSNPPHLIGRQGVTTCNNLPQVSHAQQIVQTLPATPNKQFVVTTSTCQSIYKHQNSDKTNLKERLGNVVKVSTPYLGNVVTVSIPDHINTSPTVSTPAVNCISEKDQPPSTKVNLPVSKSGTSSFSASIKGGHSLSADLSNTINELGKNEPIPVDNSQSSNFKFLKNVLYAMPMEQGHRMYRYDGKQLTPHEDLAASFAWKSSLSKPVDVPEKDDEVASPQKSVLYSEKSSKENFKMITPPLLSPEENHEFVKCSVRVFKDWLAQHGIPTQFENLPVSSLDIVLKQFLYKPYLKDGTTLNLEALDKVLTGVSRYLNGEPYNRRIDIVTKYHPSFVTDFQRKTLVSSNTERYPLNSWYDTPKHFKIQNEDMVTLYQYLSNTGNPKILQFKVIFEILLHFYYCKFQAPLASLQSLTRQSFSFGTNKKGQYVKVNTPDSKDEIVIYCNPKKMHCPFKSIQKYLSKLNPKLDRFLQKPASEDNSIALNFDDLNQDVWYLPEALGDSFLKTFMKRLSHAACLKITYSNAHVKQTAINIYRERHAGELPMKSQNDTKHFKTDNLRNASQRSSVLENRKQKDTGNDDCVKNLSATENCSIQKPGVFCSKSSCLIQTEEKYKDVAFFQNVQTRGVDMVDDVEIEENLGFENNTAQNTILILPGGTPTEKSTPNFISPSIILPGGMPTEESTPNFISPSISVGNMTIDKVSNHLPASTKTENPSITWENSDEKERLKEELITTVKHESKKILPKGYTCERTESHIPLKKRKIDM